jgi:uncharacterized membrane protein YfcA
MLWPLTVPSLVTAFLGGLLVLGGQVYFILTGLLLIAAAILMVFERTADTVEHWLVDPLPAFGAGAGFISGLTGVGDGVFVTPLLIVLDWASPRRAATFSPPFILCNSVLGLLVFFFPGNGSPPAHSFIRLARSAEASSVRPSDCAGCQSARRATCWLPFRCLPGSAC